NTYTCDMDKRPKAATHVIYCQCTASDKECCGDHCEHRRMKVECVNANCRCGDRCSNRRLQKRQWRKCEIKRNGKQHFGLYALQDIKCGELVIEFVGEVIDMYEQSKRRMKDEYNPPKQAGSLTPQKKETLQDSLIIRVVPIVNLKNGICILINGIDYYIDLKKKKKKSDVAVGEDLCIGIFAQRDIVCGEELTFAFDFERFNGTTQTCNCDVIPEQTCLHDKAFQQLSSNPMEDMHFSQEHIGPAQNIFPELPPDQSLYFQTHDPYPQLSDVALSYHPSSLPTGAGVGG
ncbi:set domain protein, partial [Reticulomyxa filosa]